MKGTYTSTFHFFIVHTGKVVRLKRRVRLMQTDLQRQSPLGTAGGVYSVVELYLRQGSLGLTVCRGRTVIPTQTSRSLKAQDLHIRHFRLK